MYIPIYRERHIYIYIYIYSRGYAHAAALEGASGSSYHVEIHPKSVLIQQNHQNSPKKAQVYKNLIKNQRQSCKIGVK